MNYTDNWKTRLILLNANIQDSSFFLVLPNAIVSIWTKVYWDTANRLQRFLIYDHRYLGRVELKTWPFSMSIYHSFLSQITNKPVRRGLRARDGGTPPALSYLYFPVNGILAAASAGIPLISHLWAPSDFIFPISLWFHTLGILCFSFFFNTLGLPVILR